MNRILYFIIYGIFYTFSLLPLRVLYILSDGMYFVIYRLLRYRRRVVRENLERSFPEKDAKEITKIEQQFYHWFCDYLGETFKMLSISSEEMSRRMVFKGTDEINRLLSEGVSCGVFLGHYCNWEWVSTLPLALKNGYINAELYHPLENVAFNDLFLKLRQRFGSVCIPMQEALRQLLKYRNEGQPIIIGYIADQKPHWRNMHLWMDFLNHKDTPILTGSERLVKRMRQAFFYADMKRVKRGYYECEFKLMERDTKDIPDFQITERYMKELEKTINRDPAFWLWSHDRWARTREEFDRHFYEKDGHVIKRHEEE